MEVLSIDRLSGILVGGILTVFAFGQIASFVMAVLEIIGGWKVFEKLGEPGWKAIIPFYNCYVEYKYTWKPVMALPVIILGLGCGVAMQYAADGSALKMVLSLAFLVGWGFSIVGFHKLSRAFGKGMGFTIGMVLFPGIFRMILGFGKAKYVGNTSATAQE